MINGRPGATGPTAELLNFTLARYVRLRLQKIRTLNADLMSRSGGLQRNSAQVSQGGANASPPESDRSLFQRLFYPIRNISIGGQCVCYGHAASFPYERQLGYVVRIRTARWRTAK